MSIGDCWEWIAGWLRVPLAPLVHTVSKISQLFSRVLLNKSVESAKISPIDIESGLRRNDVPPNQNALKPQSPYSNSNVAAKNQSMGIKIRRNFGHPTSASTILNQRFWHYMVHVVMNKAGGTVDDLNRLIAFLSALPAYFGPWTIVIDGLNMTWLLKKINKYSIHGPIILVWREGVRIPRRFAQLIEGNGFAIRVLQVTPNISEIDDLFAMYIALVTNGQLITNDAIRNHFNDFDRYYENERVKVDLRSHLNVEQVKFPARARGPDGKKLRQRSIHA